VRGLHVGSGFDAQFVGQPGTQVGEQAQRGGLFTQSVQGEHEPGVQSFMHRFAVGERAQLGGGLVGAAEVDGEVGIGQRCGDAPPGGGDGGEVLA
jgi:hypothetical protein